MRSHHSRNARTNAHPVKGSGGSVEQLKPLLVFDMDGVLVDVTESYRETIAQTVAHFTSAPVSNDQIQSLKNQGGFNDDWKLSHHMISSAGVDVPFEDVKAHFQKLFLEDGLMLRERWVATSGT